MQMSNNDDFARISAECQRHLKAGMLDWYAFDLKSMAAILGKEEKHIDKLKVLMLAFYIDLSGVSQRPFIDRALLASITTAAIRSGLDKHQIDELYMDTVQADTTPNHVMTVKDSLYLLELCLAGRELEAEELLAGLLKTQSPYVSE